MPDDAEEELGIILRIREKERIAHYAKKMGMTIAEARQESNEDVEYALLIWQLDEQRAKLQSKEQKTE